MTIKYVGYYGLGDMLPKRLFPLSGANKMNYIIDCLNRVGCKVEVISPAYSSENGTGKYTQIKKKISENVEIVFTPTRNARNKIDRIIRVLQSKFWLFNYLCKNTKKNEKVIVYHQYDVAIPIVLAQKIKKFKIILEVEDYYSKVWKISRFKQWEERLLLKYAGENSIFVSEVLRDKFGFNNSMICYGSYKVFDTEKHDHDSVCNLLFSGSIDSDRGGAFIAIESMQYLPLNYHLNISGPIAEKDKDAFYKSIENMNNLLGYEACTYKGVLSQKDYEELLLSTDIALNPQKSGTFGEYIFPSKILTYFCWGLPVVSTKGESIVNSELSDLISFSDDYSPESVAKAILNSSRGDGNKCKERIKKLDKAFLSEIITLVI